MTSEPRQPGPGGRTPRFDEHDLLAFVEDTLPAARADLVRRTVARDPQLAAKVEAMRADRAMLADLVEDRAPEGLVAAALGQLELGALLDADPRLRLTDAPPDAASMSSEQLAPMPGDPMSVLRVGQRKRASRVPWTPLVGVAAVVLLGVGVWTSGLVTRDMLPGGLAGESEMLAQGDIVPPTSGIRATPRNLEVEPIAELATAPVLSGATSAESGAAGPGFARAEPSSLASAIDAQIDAQIDANADAEASAQSARPSERLAAVDGVPAPHRDAMPRDGLAPDRRPDAVVVDAARAAHLAAEGRLAIRVPTVPTAGGSTLSRSITDRLGTPTAAGRLTMPEADVERDTQLARAVVPRPEFVWSIDAFAGGDRERRSRARDRAPTERPPAPPSVLAIDTLADARTLERARLALDADAAFIELDEPSSLRVPIQPSEVLWWTQPADRWAPRVRVPVVVYEAR